MRPAIEAGGSRGLRKLTTRNSKRAKGEFLAVRRRLSLEPLEDRCLLSVFNGDPDAAASPTRQELLLAEGAVPITWDGVETYARPGEWIASFDGITGSPQEQTEAIQAILDGAAAPSEPGLGDGELAVSQYLGMDGLVLIDAPDEWGMKAYEVLTGLANVEYAEPNFADLFQAATFPNDPSFSQLWGLHNTGQSGGTPDADIDAPEAWDISRGSSSIVVGVIDTGVNYTHPDLAGNMWTNPGEIPGNGIDDDSNGYIDDVYGWDFYNNDNNPMDDHSHGSHCAGTIGGVGNNAQGVAGVNWDVGIMALKFLSAGGSGPTSAAVSCVNYATMMHQLYRTSGGTRGANVLLTSNSWGGGGFSTALRNAIQASANEGLLFVAAAGNDGANTDTSPHYPSCYDVDNIISVAATDRNDLKASFSNYGLTTVDLGAPGVSIYSTVLGTSYGSKSGTSMAAPHVSGVAALAWSIAPGADYDEIRDAILAGVDVIPSMTGRTVTGGRLNAFNTLQEFGMRVVDSTPDDGDVITAPPTAFTLDFSMPYALASVQATDLRVNTEVADGFALVDADTITFYFADSPVTAQGLQSMAVAAGAIEAVGGSPVAAWNASFRYDALLMQVVSTDPPEGPTTLPLTTLRVNFSEPYAAGSIGTNDLTLNFGTVTGFSLVDPDTVEYTIDGVTEEGLWTVDIAAGALTDTYGNPCAAYSGSYDLDFGVLPFPVPLESKLPLGSLIYDPSQSGVIGFPGDTDGFTINLDPGQKVTLIVDPESTLRPTLELRDPGSASLGSGEASVPGETVILQTIPIIEGGTYTVAVIGAGGTTGEFNLTVMLNAAAEEELNDDIGSAQDIEASFLPIGLYDAERGAVIGRADGTGGGGRILLVEDQGGFGNAASVLAGEGFDVTVVNNEYARNYADLLNTSYLAGFDFVVYGERGGGYGNVLPVAVQASLENYIQNGGHLLVTGYDTLGSPTDSNLANLVRAFGPGDQVSYSASWQTANIDVFMLNGPYGNYRNRSFSARGYDDDVLRPDTARGAITIATTPSYTSRVIYTDLPGAGGSVGYWNGGLSGTTSNAQPDFSDGGIPQNIFLNWADGVTQTGPGTPDFYAFELEVNEPATLAVTSLSGGEVEIELWHSGMPVAFGSPPTGDNVDEVISNFVGPAGTYYARVIGGAGVDYSLVITRGAAFDTEDNNSFANAQAWVPKVGPGGAEYYTALGGLGVGGGGGGGVIEPFDDGDIVEYVNVGVSGAYVTAAAAHDGPFGLEDRDGSGWIYRDDMQVHLQQGDVFSAWVRTTSSTDWSRAYFGFGATSTGCYSLVMGVNTDNLVLQRNDGYGFLELGAAPQSWLANHWYRMEVDWNVGGNMTGRLYDSDGTTLLNTVTASDNSRTAGGLAFRAFGSTKHFDTVELLSDSGSTVAGIDLAIVAADPASDAPISQLMATGYFDTITFYDVRSSTPSLPTLQAYDAILAYTNYTPASAVGLGNVLADYVDAGGHLVLSTYSFSNSWDIEGRIMTAGYSPLTNVGINGNVSGSVVATVPSDPIFDGINVGAITYFHNSNFAHPGLDPGATLLATDGAGNKMIARNADGNVLGMNFFPGTSVSGNNQELYDVTGNAIAEAGGDGPGPGPDSGDWYQIEVTAGETITVSTETPADGPGEFVNVLDPHIELYAPSDPTTPIAAGTPGADGRNESLTYAALVTGAYRVRIVSEGGTTGEYVLSTQKGAGGVPPWQLDVQKDATQRSYVRYLDLIFESDLASAPPMQLTRYNLDGSGPGVPVDLTGKWSLVDNRIEIDFGEQGIGGDRNSPVGNGYYEMAVDRNLNGSFDPDEHKHFYRLLGDVDGNRAVERADIYAILYAYGQSGPNLENDANGDGVVNALDRVLAMRAYGLYLDPALTLDD